MRDKPCVHGIEALRCSICDGPEEWLGGPPNEESLEALRRSAAFRSQYVSEPPPMRSCREIEVPHAILVHGERGSGRTHTLIDTLIATEREREKDPHRRLPFLLVTPKARWLTGGEQERLHRAGVASLVVTAIDYCHHYARGRNFAGLLVDGWLELTPEQRERILVGRLPVRFFTL